MQGLLEGAMASRVANCSCGQLRVTCEGEPAESQCVTALSANGAPAVYLVGKHDIVATRSKSPAIQPTSALVG